MKKRIIVLGCTGSIGKSTLELVREFPDLFEVVGLQAHSNEKLLLDLGKEFSCTQLCLTGKNIGADVLNSRIIYYGKSSINNLIKYTDADIVVNGISGAEGLIPSVTALETGKHLALANKETMVMAGNIVKKIAKANNVKILPVDSEHSAIFSLIEKCGNENIENITITASGGAFKNLSKEELENVTLEQALNHPTWDMGPKITIDSATLANKGLEVIEANQLFDLPKEKINVVIHPQSLIHSFVQTKDGDLYAQISKPDMRHPILTALTYPDVIENSLDKIDFSKAFQMEFYPPRFDDFPMLNLAYKALEKGGSYSIVYNAVNEIAVAAFRNKQIKFTDISKIVEKIMNLDWSKTCTEIEEVVQIDYQARNMALQALKELN